jgi:hypothetical protein
MFLITLNCIEETIIMNSLSSNNQSETIPTEYVLFEKFNRYFTAAKQPEILIESQAINESQYSTIKLMILRIIDFFSADEQVLKKKDFTELNEYQKVLRILDLNHMKSS